MAGPLKNEGRERYAQELAKGTAQAEAYAKVGFRGGKTGAANMAARDDVRARVAEIQQRAAAKVEITVADIAKQLDEDREFAKKCKQAGAVVSATLGKAKVLGLITDKHELAGRNGGPIEYRNLSDEEVEARIRAHEENADRPTAH